MMFIAKYWNPELRKTRFYTIGAEDLREAMRMTEYYRGKAPWQLEMLTQQIGKD